MALSLALKVNKSLSRIIQLFDIDKKLLNSLPNVQECDATTAS